MSDSYYQFRIPTPKNFGDMNEEQKLAFLVKGAKELHESLQAKLKGLKPKNAKTS